MEPAPDELPAEQPPAEGLLLPPLPPPGLPPSVVAATLALPGQWIGWLLYAVLLPFGFEGHTLAWVAMALVLGLMIRRDYPLRRAMQREPPLPATLTRAANGRLQASVLVRLEPHDDDVTLYAMSAPLASSRGLDRASPDGARVIGYLFSEFGRTRFMPLIAQTVARTAAFADPARMPAVYFELLALCLREGEAAGGTALRLSLPLERARALLEETSTRVPDKPAQEPSPASDGGESAALALWCAGLPFQGEEAVTAQDLESLARSRTQALRRALAFASFDVAALGALLVLVLFGLRALPQPLTVACMLLVALSLVFYWMPYRICQDLRFAADARRAARGGRVWLFAGQLAWDDAYGQDADVAWLVAHDLLRPDDQMPQSVRVTPERGLVVLANGKAPPRPLQVRVVSMSKGNSMVVSLPSDAQARIPPGAVMRRRTLTAPERVELERHLRRIRPIRFTTVVVPLAGVLCVAAVPAEVPWWIFTGYGFWSLLLFWHSYRRFRGQQRLEGDLDLGWILIVARDGQQYERNARLELLAGSGTPWAEFGTPASWRRQKEL